MRCVRFAALHCLLSAVVLCGACGPIDQDEILSPIPGMNPDGSDRTFGAPLIDSLSPGAGPNCGGPLLVVTGQNFASGTKVTVGGMAAADVSVWSSTRLTARLAAAPGATGPAEVIVQNPDGQRAARGDLFRYHDCNVILPTPLFDPGGRSVLAVADFNHDGKPDVAVDSGTSVHVLLNDGNGGFSDPVSSPSGFSVAVARAVAADLNGDQNLDLVLFKGGAGGQASVLLGDSAGGFAPPRVFTVSGVVYSAVTGDFNGDGKVDLVFHNLSTLMVLMGDGTGNFGAATTVTVGSSSTSSNRLAAGDFNSDGKSDLAFPGSAGKISILLSDGRGGFTPASTLTASSNSRVLIAVDLNGDKMLDLVAGGNSGTIGAWTFLGDGAGGFGPGQSILMTAADLRSFSVVDLNRDQIPDLIGCDSSFTNAQGLWVMQGNGTGGFTSTNRYFGSCSTAEGADFNGDDNPDVISGNPGAVLYLGNGRGGLYAPGSLGNARGPLAVGDLDGDQNLDIVGEWGGIATLTDGKGGVVAVASGTPFSTDVGSLLLADINGDRNLDLAAPFRADVSTYGVGVKIGDGKGNFGPPIDLGFPGAVPVPYLLGATDLNGDQRADLIVVDSSAQSFTVIYGNGLGDLSKRTRIPIPSLRPFSLVTGDFNADRRQDLVIGQTGSIVVYLGDGAGAFAAPVQLPISGKASALAVGDINGDDRLDLAFTDQTANSSGLLFGDGQGGFSAGNMPIGAGGSCVALADLNGDTKLDLILPSTASRVLLGDGRGGFARAQTYAYLSCVTGEFTGDARLDVVYGSSWLLRSQGF